MDVRSAFMYRDALKSAAQVRRKYRDWANIYSPHSFYTAVENLSSSYSKLSGWLFVRAIITAAFLSYSTNSVALSNANSAEQKKSQNAKD